VPPRARRQAGQPDLADADADQPRHGMAHGGQHPAHLPVAAFVDGQLDLGAAAALPRLAGRTRQADVLGGPGRAVFQMDTAPEPVQRVWAGDAPD